jgi:hypothetical protein
LKKIKKKPMEEKPKRKSLSKRTLQSSVDTEESPKSSPSVSRKSKKKSSSEIVIEESEAPVSRRSPKQPRAPEPVSVN